MKRFITLVAFCFPVIAFAQIEKGKSVVSADIGFSSGSTKWDNSDKTDKGSAFTFGASYAYLVSDRWAIGINPSLDLAHSVSENNATESHTTMISGGPFVRRYFAISEKFFINVDGGVSFSSQKNKSEGTNTGVSTTTKQTGFGIAISPGVTYLVSNKFALQAFLGNISYSQTKPEGYKYWTFSSNLGITSITLGGSWIF